MPRFRKKSVEIEAFQMTKEQRESNFEWPEWMHKAWQLEREAPGSLYPTKEGTGDGTLSIGTLEGQHLVSWGDFIIQGVQGELYPCKPDIFALTYEPADTPAICQWDKDEILMTIRTGCGIIYYYTDNEPFNFCPYCGQKIMHCPF